MRARERSEAERAKRRQASSAECGSGGVLDGVRQLQKSVLMAQLQQLQQLNSMALQPASRQPSQWQPFEYEFWGEIFVHTTNFLKYFRQHYDMPPGFLLQLRRQAHRWRKDYKGLTEEDFDQIMEYRRSAQDRRRNNPLRDSPEAMLREL